MSNLFAILRNVVLLPFAFVFDLVKLLTWQNKRIERVEISVNDLTFYTLGILDSSTIAS